MERLSHELGKDVAEISAGALMLLMDYDDFGFLSRKMEHAGSGRLPFNVTL